LDLINVNRREFIKKLSIGALATGGLLTAGPIIASAPDMKLPDPYPELPDWKPSIPSYNNQALFFDEHQYALVAILAAIIIPSDDDPGATEAGVVDYIDRSVADSEKRQRMYTKGLKWIDDLSQEEYGTDFLTLDIEEQINLLRRIDESATMRQRPASGFMERVDRKIDKIWDDQFGIGKNSVFFRTIHRDVIFGFYSSPISWQPIGYFGPPQPVGYLDFSQPPSSANYTGSVRQVRNESCLICHNEGKKHPRGKLIDHTCNTCHRPHSPWPRKKNGFYLEDQIEVIFSSPDRKKEAFLDE
jgi:gluconate 2-dehydrogenase gamma chain